jgi:hypothetical protein
MLIFRQMVKRWPAFKDGCHIYNLLKRAGQSTFHFRSVKLYKDVRLSVWTKTSVATVPTLPLSPSLLPHWHIYSVLLTYSWSWALLQEPPNLQLLKNFPAFYRTRRFITVFTRALHRSISWTKSIQSIPSHPISLRSIIDNHFLTFFFRTGVCINVILQCSLCLARADLYSVSWHRFR